MSKQCHTNTTLHQHTRKIGLKGLRGMAWTEITGKIIGIIETFLKNLNETIKHL